MQAHGATDRSGRFDLISRGLESPLTDKASAHTLMYLRMCRYSMPADSIAKTSSPTRFWAIGLPQEAVT